MEIISNLRKLNKLRSLFINFSFRSVANLITKVFGLITLPIITRALGPDGYGQFNLINIVVIYTSMPFGLLGLKTYAIREIAAERKSDSYASNILSMQFTTALISVFLSLIITFFIFRTQLNIYLTILLGYIIVFTNVFNLEFFFVAKKDLVFPTIASMVGQIFYVVGVILFIKNPKDVPVLVFLSAFPLGIADLIQLIKFNMKFGDVKINFSYKETLITLKDTYKLGISQNLEGFYPSVVQILIPILLSTYALGIFSGGYKIYGIVAMFYSTLFYALAPYLVQLNKFTIKTRKKYHFLLFVTITSISMLMGLSLYLFAEPLMLLVLGKSFNESGPVFKAISITLIPLQPLIMLFGNILIFSGHEKYYLYSTIVASITILIFSPLLIKNLNVVGGVYAMAFAMFTGLLVLIYYYFKTEKYNIILQKK